MTPERKTELVRRRIRELVEFLVIGPRKDASQNLGGRTTGIFEKDGISEKREFFGTKPNYIVFFLGDNSRAHLGYFEFKISRI